MATLAVAESACHIAANPVNTANALPPKSASARKDMEVQSAT